ncbi:deoxyguanosinetriphosphate triphosphohydrolase [Chloroflexota bacterium]
MIQLGIRERLEEREKGLSTHAARSKLSRGRLQPEEPCPMRTAFQRDRDRIIHSKAFRRLKHKTQVFITPSGDHYVTRLTHTLEVSQIARTISRALNLNEDLTEAIALGHDLGHTPFGHIGEEALDELYPEGFRHNEQSLRVVDLLEREGEGLNLTWEVRDGILNHSKARAEVFGQEWGPSGTLEGQVCKVADIIAYINHDIEDALRAGIVTKGDLPPSAIALLGDTHSQRINTLVCDIVAHSLDRSETPLLAMSPQIQEATNILRDFLFDRVYNPSTAKEESERARQVIRLLYFFFMEHEGNLPGEYLLRHDPLERRVIDYIAGMTDQFALRLAEEVSPLKQRATSGG